PVGGGRVSPQGIEPLGSGGHRHHRRDQRETGEGDEPNAFVAAGAVDVAVRRTRHYSSACKVAGTYGRRRLRTTPKMRAPTRSRLRLALSASDTGVRSASTT